MDLVITNSDNDIRIAFPIIGDMISDHYAVKCSLSIFKPSVQVKTTQVRNLKDIDISSFKAELLKTELITEPSDGLTELVNQYNVCLAELLDTFAPLTERKIRSSNRKK